MMVTLQFDHRIVLAPLPENIRATTNSDRTVTIQVPAGKSVNQTLKDLEIKLSQAVVAVVNGQTTDLEQPLGPGDEVRLLPQISGGDR
jgi:molybdopterin converting factor small subunit